MMGRGKKKYSFQNPLRQNYKHTKSLSNYLGLSHEVMHSIVFFIGECKLKTKMPKNVMTSGVSRYIKGFERVILESHEIENTVTKINEALNDPSLTTKAHLQSLKGRHSGNSSKPKKSVKASKEKFIKLKDTKCAKSTCDYKGNLQRTKKGKFLVYSGASMVWIALLGALIEIVNVKVDSLFMLLILLLIGKYSQRTAINGSKILQCPQCSIEGPRLSNPENLPFKSPAESQTKSPEISIDLYILINNEVQGPYQEDQILE